MSFYAKDMTLSVKKLCRILTDMQQITDIAYRPICIGRNDYRYIGFADMGYIGRYRYANPATPLCM